MYKKIGSLKISIIFLAIFFGCSKENSYRHTPETVNDEIFKILKKSSNELRIPSTISMPIVINSNRKMISLFDYSDSKVKVLLNNSDVISFNPLGYGDNRLGGTYFRGLGYSSTSTNNLLVGSESIIREYDVLNKEFGATIDSFPECSSFDSQFSQIFEINNGSNRYVVSQHGVPCINVPRDGMPFSKSEFQSLKFLRTTDVKSKEFNYSFSIPEDNEILAESKLYVKTYPLVVQDVASEYFYAMINPTNQLIQLKFIPQDLSFATGKTWNLNLPFFYNHVEYTLNNGINRELSGDNYKYNPELKLLKVHGDTIAVLYRPGFKESERNGSKYISHYFLYVSDMASGNHVTYALNYKEIFFLNYLDNGIVWFYDVSKSELSSKAEVVVRSINMYDLLN